MPNGNDGFGGAAWWLHQTQLDPDTGIVIGGGGDYIDIDTGEMIESGYGDQVYDQTQEFGWGDFDNDITTKTDQELAFNFAILVVLGLMFL
jgi:hypothetical protein